MEGEVDAGVAPSIFLPGRFSDAPGMPRKRDFLWTNPGFQHVCHQRESQHLLVGYGLPNPSNSNGWNPKLWDWDRLKFTTTPSEAAPKPLSLGDLGAEVVMKQGNGAEQMQNVGDSGKTLLFNKGVDEDSETLTLKIGIGACAVEELAKRPNKRVRSGLPGSASSYPICQVDDCKTALSNAKDYHRRHKVCEIHSKAAKAFVGHLMLRFCQQCSRLAGHNRRRRKTQPEDASSNILVPRSHDGKVIGGMNIVNLLAILTQLQGNSTNMSSLPENDLLLQILGKVDNLPLANASSKTQVQRGFDLNVSEAPQQIPKTPQQSSLKQPSEESGNPSAPSTMNLLAVLSATLASSSSNTLTTLLDGSSDASETWLVRTP